MLKTEIIEILKKIEPTTSDEHRFVLGLIIRNMEYNERWTKYYVIGGSLVMLGLGLGWFCFGHFPSLKVK